MVACGVQLDTSGATCALPSSLTQAFRERLRAEGQAEQAAALDFEIDETHEVFSHPMRWILILGRPGDYRLYRFRLE
jgi:hypothetical protein